MPKDIGLHLRGRGWIMHGGLPIIGFSTIIYGAVGLTAVVGRAITKIRRRP
jgi:hypothetical protein